MGHPKSDKVAECLLDQILGYLNFSAGNHDKKFFGNLNQLFDHFTNDDGILQDILASRCRTVPRRSNCQTKESREIREANGFRISLQQLFSEYDRDPFEGQLSYGRKREDSQPAQSDGDAKEAAQSDLVLAFAEVHRILADRIKVLRRENDTFRDADQASETVRFVFEVFLPAYLRHHRDLLFHQNVEVLFNSFFLGRVFETVLSQGFPFPTEPRLLRAVMGTINDHLGHRPVATLETQKIEPYEHEFIRPIPVYITGVGTAAGPYASLVDEAIKIIRETSPTILRRARFDPERLEELAIDPRAFDFDHPVNKRPNHHFGSWDEQEIDGDGYFRRFIIHQVALDSLLARVEAELAAADEVHETGDGADRAELKPTRAELQTEAASVLACTILMSSAISGDYVGAYDSTVTLGELLPVIAGYRDEFYAELIPRLSQSHQDRLAEERKQRHQPFGAARQSLNSKLSRHRASQLVNCRLASIFARMGFPDAARIQLDIVPVASARIVCQIDCLLSAATQAINAGELDDALAAIPRMVELINRGIGCGAIVDPWNIIGFDANYSLFPAIENTVRDHRAFDLVDLVESVMALCSRLWSEAAAEDRTKMCEEVRREFFDIVDWWRKFAAYEVMSVDAVDPQEIAQAAELVATALNLWHKGGAATGDIAFWAGHAQLFDSPKAYSLVIEALMQRGDFATTTALLVHWLSQADVIGLQQGDSSFHNLMFRWVSEQKRALLGLLDPATNSPSGKDESGEQSADTPEVAWNRIRKFYDFLEANADQYWQVPQFELTRDQGGGQTSKDDGADTEALLDPDDGRGNSPVFDTAYDENFVYQDSTDDGFEGEVFDGSQHSDEELEAEVDRVLDRLEFLGTLSSFWRIAATIPLSVDAQTLTPEGISDSLKSRLQTRRDIAAMWVRQADTNRQDLMQLLSSINKYKLPETSPDQESMLIYDQHRLYKESLLDQAINTCVGTENAVRALLAVIKAIDTLLADPAAEEVSPQPDGQADDVDAGVAKALENTADEVSPLIHTLAGILLQDPKAISENFSDLIEYLEQQSILYIPLAKGGTPESIVQVRVIQTAILDLLRTLPMMGLFAQTFMVTRTALWMERKHPVAQGAVSEFDELFHVAYTSMVGALIDSTHEYQQWLTESESRPESEAVDQAENVLFDCIEMLTESMLILWLDHSKTLRLSVLEKVIDAPRWEALVKFIKHFGEGLFTQHFLHVGNIRAILHQGVDHWLQQVQESPNPPELKLFDALEDGGLDRKTASAWLTLILESVLENFNEYRDYNTTTTQSDSGELLYLFLDFLRLRTRYDRVCWNLKPVIWAHKMLVNKQRTSVARMWRRSLNDRIGPEAQKYVDQLEALQKEYSVEMQSVARHIEGRFGSEMQIDRLTSQVKSAMADPPSRESHRAFDLLQSEAQKFSQTTMGVGIDLPAWLAALEDEVQQMHLPARLRTQRDALYWRPPKAARIAHLREQLEDLPRREE